MVFENSEVFSRVLRDSQVMEKAREMWSGAQVLFVKVIELCTDGRSLLFFPCPLGSFSERFLLPPGADWQWQGVFDFHEEKDPTLGHTMAASLI